LANGGTNGGGGSSRAATAAALRREHAASVGMGASTSAPSSNERSGGRGSGRGTRADRNDKGGSFNKLLDTMGTKMEASGELFKRKAEAVEKKSGTDATESAAKVKRVDAESQANTRRLDAAAAEDLRHWKGRYDKEMQSFDAHGKSAEDWEKEFKQHNRSGEAVQGLGHEVEKELAKKAATAAYQNMK